jgi:hypothetical protein
MTSKKINQIEGICICGHSRAEHTEHNGNWECFANEDTCLCNGFKLKIASPQIKYCRWCGTEIKDGHPSKIFCVTNCSDRLNSYWRGIVRDLIYCERRHSFVHRLGDKVGFDYKQAQHLAFEVLKEMQKEYDNGN